MTVQTAVRHDLEYIGKTLYLANKYNSRSYWPTEGIIYLTHDVNEDKQ